MSFNRKFCKTKTLMRKVEIFKRSKNVQSIKLKQTSRNRRIELIFSLCNIIYYNYLLLIFTVSFIFQPLVIPTLIKSKEFDFSAVFYSQNFRYGSSSPINPPRFSTDHLIDRSKYLLSWTSCGFLELYVVNSY